MQPLKGRLHVPRSQEQLSVQSQHPNPFQRGFLWDQLEESQEIHCNANANNSQLEEPSGATSPGLKQLFSWSQEKARGYLKTSLETGLATWLPSSNSHHARAFNTCLLFSWAFCSNLCNFWCWVTQKLSMIWESDLSLAYSGQMWLIPMDRWCSSGKIRHFIVLINPSGTLKVQY